MRGFRFTAVVLIVLASLPISTWAGKGFYGPVPLRDREKHLLESADEYQDRFARHGYLVLEEGANELVRGIGELLTPKPTDWYIKYQFHILRDPVPNAFALPNGHIYIHSGMLAFLDNEAQLATLLAHEINHAAGHHGIRTFY